MAGISFTRPKRVVSCDFCILLVGTASVYGSISFVPQAFLYLSLRMSNCDK